MMYNVDGERLMLAYSFAKTPLHAAQAPLIIASSTQEDFGFVLDIVARNDA
jgi:hypothetical protein